jgi:hypothetical protein
MNDFMPPPVPSAQTIESLFALLAAVSDPAAVKSRIADLVAQTQAVNDACAELAAERKRLTDENARAIDLRDKENLLATKESDLKGRLKSTGSCRCACRERNQDCGGRVGISGPAKSSR